jgi:cell division protein FtsB
VVALELKGDRLNERLLCIGLNDSTARLLDHGEEVLGGNPLVVRKGDSERKFVFGLVDLIEEHAGEASTAAPPCRLTRRAWRGETAEMKLRLERALPTTAARLRALALLLLLLAFVVLIGRSLIGALEVNAEISRLRDENAALAAEAEALTAERILLDDAAFLDLIARGYSLGSSVERPFVLAADATELPADAPGSAARRLTVAEEVRSPLDAWIEVLFGG